MSDRQIHYQLLNAPPLIHAAKPESTYRNDKASYRALTDLVFRARLAGLIPFRAIGDTTREVHCWEVHTTPAVFMQRQVDEMFLGYYRDLMQSQPNHVELVGEKNTIGSILRPVAAEFTIPLTIGRGYCSLPPRHAMAERYRRSGKDKLVLLMAADFDPEGENIVESFARSMRDDFDVEEIHAVKVALTAEQVDRFKLPPLMKAKAGSSRYKGFVAKHGEQVFELESLRPETLQQLVREAIESVIDRDAFSAEIAAERKDAADIKRVRTCVLEAIKEFDLEESTSRMNRARAISPRAQVRKCNRQVTQRSRNTGIVAATSVPDHGCGWTIGGLAPRHHVMPHWAPDPAVVGRSTLEVALGALEHE